MADHAHVRSPALLSPQVDRWGLADQLEGFSDGSVELIASVRSNADVQLANPPLFRCEVTGIVAAGWLRLDDRDRLCSQLRRATPVPLSAVPGDLELVAAAYRVWGESFAEHLMGDFAIVVWDSVRTRLILARDRVGIKPLFYSANGSDVSFATSLPALKGLPGVDDTPDPVWMANVLMGGVFPSYVRSAFSGARRVPPGHALVFERASQRLVRYHRFVDDSPWETRRDRVWLERYREVLHTAVRDQSESAFPLGCETTGGIDSSTIIGVTAVERPELRERMHTFGFATLPMEPEYTLETSRAHRIASNHIFTDWDTEGDVREREIEALGHPAEHGNVDSHLPFYRLAQLLGVRTLMSGHGGDEIVTNEAERAVAEFLRRDPTAVWQVLGGNPAARSARAVRQWWRARRPAGEWFPPPVTQLRTLIVPEIADALVASSQRAYDPDAHPTTVNGHIMADRMGPGMLPRIEQGSILAAAFGVDYRWPLLDARLVQQYLSTPTVWKRGDGFGRYLHRRAIDGTVPDKITWKPTKAMGARMVPVPAADIARAATAPAVRDILVSGGDRAELTPWQARNLGRALRRLSEWAERG